MYIPRARSDPGAPRRDRIWKQRLPRLPTRAHVQPIPQFHGPRYQCPGTPSVGSAYIPHVQTRSVGVNALSIETQEKPRRSCFMRILMAPCDFLKWFLKKWCAPNENCMRCVNVTYWLVLILGGLISAAAALTPFL